MTRCGCPYHAACIPRACALHNRAVPDAWARLPPPDAACETDLPGALARAGPGGMALVDAHARFGDDGLAWIRGRAAINKLIMTPPGDRTYPLDHLPHICRFLK